MKKTRGDEFFLEIPFLLFSVVLNYEHVNYSPNTHHDHPKKNLNVTAKFTHVLSLMQDDKAKCAEQLITNVDDESLTNHK